jgi:hypothetical protein
LTSDHRRTRVHALVMVAFLAITLIQTWPLAAQLSHVLPNDVGDPVLNTWILSWNAQVLPLTRGWWDAPMFYPTRGVMAFSETLLGLSLVASPLQWIGASPVVAYNVLFLLSFPLSAFTAYLLAWSLTRRTGPAIVAGVIYGYAIFRFAHLGHLQILWSWWMPLALLGLHRWMTDRRASALLLFGAAWLGESLSNGYYLLYFSIIVGLWLAWFTPWREARRLLVPVLLTWMAAAACLAPILLTYTRVQHANRLYRGFDEIDRNSADVLDFFRVSAATRFPGLEDQQRAEREVSLGFVGTCVLAAGIAAVLAGVLTTRGRAWRDRKALAFYVSATLVAMVLALGPRPRAGGVELLHQGPYAWLMAVVPGFTGVRVPARFTLLAVLCLAIAAALLLARVRLATATRERCVFGAIALIALLDTWPRPIGLPSVPPLVDPRVLAPAAVVLELPVGWDHEFLALYRSMFHRHPLVNGYSGYTPASYDTLRLCLQGQYPYCLTQLRQLGPLDVVIDRQSDADGVWEHYALQLPDAQFQFQNRQFTIFHFPALPDSTR